MTPSTAIPSTKWGLLPGDRCPLTIYLDAKGRVFDSRFNGRFRVSQSTLETDVVGGCKEDGQTSSVRIEASPGLPYGKVTAFIQRMRALRPDIPVMLVAAKDKHRND